LLHLRFRAFQRHRHGRVVVEQVLGLPIVVLPQVMNPVLFGTGQYLAQVVTEMLSADGERTRERVLDMGTGSGIGAVFAARYAREVVAVDINPDAVRCARINVLLHGLEERVTVREGDLFAPVQGERFDLVLFNPPFLPGQPRDQFERALWSTDVLERFGAGLREHLAEDGAALVVLSSLAEHGHHLEFFRERGYRVEPMARRRSPGEVITVYRLDRGHP
jgi:release factor glutamine methyltransferase